MKGGGSPPAAGRATHGSLSIVTGVGVQTSRGDTVLGQASDHLPLGEGGSLALKP